jgi:hypothetical protein
MMISFKAVLKILKRRKVSHKKAKANHTTNMPVQQQEKENGHTH